MDVCGGAVGGCATEYTNNETQRKKKRQKMMAQQQRSDATNVTTEHRYKGLRNAKRGPVSK
jgi:hypothetical protein